MEKRFGNFIDGMFLFGCLEYSNKETVVDYDIGYYLTKILFEVFEDAN